MKNSETIVKINNKTEGEVQKKLLLFSFEFYICKQLFGSI